MDKYLLGFLLVLGAGLSTGIGSAVVYNSRLVVLASKEVLGISLGLSTGVMLYVSFVEIFQKSVSAFYENVGLDFGMAYFWATFCFFAGVVCIRLIDKVVHYLAPSDLHLHALDLGRVPDLLKEDDIKSLTRKDEEDLDVIELEEGKFGEKDDGKRRSPGQEDKAASVAATNVVSSEDTPLVSPDGTKLPVTVTRAGAADGANEQVISTEDKNDKENGEKEEEKRDCKHGGMEMTEEHVSLKRMGLFTALAIAIHNFPEGLATFVATLDDPTVGIALAVAIAIHNIPEGLCVSMPIYFATGNRHVAFGWGLLSGMSEILAAALAWAVLANTMDANAYGILFGLVAGMMVAICMYELLPTARKYDPDDHFVTHSVIAGMLLMSISLVIFQF